MTEHFLIRGDTKLSLDQIHQNLLDDMQKIASDFDLNFNIWRPNGNTVGRIYLNRYNRTAVAWIEENNSKYWIDTNIGIKLKEAIEKAYNQYGEDYNEFYLTMEGNDHRIIYCEDCGRNVMSIGWGTHEISCPRCGKFFGCDD